MKKIWIFIIGFVAGVITTFLVAFVISVANKPNDNLTIFPQKGECIATEGEIEIFEVIETNMALATMRNEEYKFGIVVLLIDYDGKTFFDGQKIIIPTNKCARKVGTFQYTSQDESFNTVPAVVIEYNTD